jgi:hypothetical protein
MWVYRQDAAAIGVATATATGTGVSNSNNPSLERGNVFWNPCQEPDNYCCEMVFHK